MGNTRSRTDLMLINHVSVARWFFSLGNQEDIIINISRLQLRRTVAPALILLRRLKPRLPRQAAGSGGEVVTAGRFLLLLLLLLLLLFLILPLTRGC